MGATGEPRKKAFQEMDWKLRPSGSVLLSNFLLGFCPDFNFAIARVWSVFMRAKVGGGRGERQTHEGDRKRQRDRDRATER